MIEQFGKISFDKPMGALALCVTGVSQYFFLSFHLLIVFAPQVQWAIKLYSDEVLMVAHIVNGKAPKNPSILNRQTGKMSTTSSNFTADNWIMCLKLNLSKLSTSK